MDFVAVDDALLIKEGLGDRLTHPELLEALEERGMYVCPMHFMPTN
jgi:LETM1 and EF-hand domain-containing protein 1